MADDLGQVLGVGEHCAVDHCRQIDFLPFKCDCCNRIYCLEHRSYPAHACPNSGQKDTTVIVCPICAKSVRLEPGQDPNVVFDRHTSSDCDPANYARVHKKPRCPVGGCKEKLTTINAYRCKHCNQRVCLKHRDPGDHRCAEAQAANRQTRGTLLSGTAAALGIGRNNAPPAAAAGSTPSDGARGGGAAHAGAAPRSQYDDPSNSVRGTAARRMQSQPPQPPSSNPPRWPWQQQPQPQGQQTQDQRPSAATTAAASAAAGAGGRGPTGGSAQNGNGNGAVSALGSSNANPLVPPHRPERCPQCGAAFASVERLIQHVEDFHPSAAGQPSSAAAPLAPAFPPPLTAAAAAAAGGGMFSNPLRGLLDGTIAGGPAPAAPAAGPAGGGGGGGAEVFRCHTCPRTFTDPVLLVQHAERCGAAAAATAAGGGGGSGTRRQDASAREGCAVS